MHLALYQKFGFHARFLTAIMAAPARSLERAGSWSRYSELRGTEREAAEKSCRELTEEIYEGLDLSAEIRTVAAPWPGRHDTAVGDAEPPRWLRDLPLGAGE